MRRFRGHPVHADTLDYWRNLLGHARRGLNRADDPDSLKPLIAELEVELSERDR